MLYYNQNANNYLQVKLVDSLKLARKYYAEYYVSLGDTYLKGCNNIAMLFTNNPVYVDTNSTTYPALLQANPQITSYGNPIVTDTMGWVKISGIFTAQGGEQYLTLGNFKLESQTQFTQIAPFGTGYNGAAYYVDDVAVYNLDSFCLKADAGRDTTIKIGDSVFIGSYTNGIDTIKWYNAAGQVIDSVRPEFWVHPTTTGTTMYIVEQTVNGCFSRDTVYINAILPLNFLSFSISPSLGGVRGGWSTANEINVSHFNIQRSSNGKDFTTIGKIKAKNKSYNEYNFIAPPTPEGWIAYYRIEAVDNDGRKQYSEVKTFIIHHSSLKVNVYPNPAKDIVNISCAGMKEVTIFNELGQVIQHLKTNNEQLKVDISNMAKGLYLLRIITQKNVIYNEKLIVQ